MSDLKEAWESRLRIYGGELKDIDREESSSERLFIREEYARNKLWADFITILSQHGVVQIDENQDFAPFAGIPINFFRVRPLEGQGGNNG